MRHFKTALAVAIGICLAGTAQAQDGHWTFTLENKSNHEIVEFRTQDDGEWSKNWISERIEPGDTYEMDFNTDEGECTVRTQVRFTDGGFFDADIDYCKSTTLEVGDDTMVWK